jgi:alkane 1-monooxygenase
MQRLQKFKTQIIIITMKAWNYLWLMFLPSLVIAGYFLGNWWNFLVPFCCFVLYPLTNLFVPSAEVEHSHNPGTSTSYSIVALSFVPVLIILTGWSVYVAGNTANTMLSFAGLVLSVGIVNGVLGFTLAHEFIHRFSRSEQLAGYLLLLQNNYMHYGIEHVRGHHVYACTPKDPHTAFIGESLYAYLLRAVKGTYHNAWHIEAKRISRAHQPLTIAHNRLLLFGVLQISLMLLIFFTWGKVSLIFFLLQNAVSILLLHITNYLQHYGLMRKKDDHGNFERIGEQHAWNAGHHGKTLNLFQLENHADHHMHPGRSYEKLRQHTDSPKHPLGYSFMVLLSFIPPLWFRMMNNRIPDLQNICYKLRDDKQAKTQHIEPDRKADYYNKY